MNKTPYITLASGWTIGPGSPCFLVAEIGNNHQGDFSVAKDMVAAAAEAGAQAVKFQKRDMAELFTRAGREAPYGGRNSFGPTYGEHREALELTLADMAKLKEEAESLGLLFFASSWDPVSSQAMLDMGVELIKIASADLVNIPLLRHSAQSGLPIILSTGMSRLTDIDAAVAEIRRWHDRIVLLHCNSSYPCPEEQIGLSLLSRLAKRYGLPVGYSGHETGLGPSVAAAAMGACVIERHFTLDKSMRGTDHQASLEPAEFALLARMVREVEKALLVKDKMLFPMEKASALKLRKSIVYARDLPAGHILAEADITVKCPGNGVSPIHWDAVIGARLTQGVAHEEQLSWDTLVTAAGLLTRKASM